MTALDPQFNHAIRDIAARLFPIGFDVGPDAPRTYQALKAHVAKTGRVLVYAGASDRTIYADPVVNHAFRAWHDLCHLQGGYDTNFVGEVAACRMQKRQLLAWYGDSNRTFLWQNLVEAEIVGQARYFERYGRFPVDQLAFTVAYLRDPAAALRARF